jgi:hypothetical protein
MYMVGLLPISKAQPSDLLITKLFSMSLYCNFPLDLNSLYITFLLKELQRAGATRQQTFFGQSQNM